MGHRWLSLKNQTQWKRQWTTVTGGHLLHPRGMHTCLTIILYLSTKIIQNWGNLGREEGKSLPTVFQSWTLDSEEVRAVQFLCFCAAPLSQIFFLTATDTENKYFFTENPLFFQISSQIPLFVSSTNQIVTQKSQWFVYKTLPSFDFYRNF